MPFLSQECERCEARRINSDEATPTWEQGLKSGCQCNGHAAAAISFHSQTAFPSRVAKRSPPSKPTSSAKPPQLHQGRTQAGCLTCKKRHLKCDEIKPSCQRCLRGARTCTWNVQTNSTIQQPVSLHRITIYTPQYQRINSDTYSSTTTNEQRALAFFRSRTAIDLAAHYVTSDLWSRYILQMALYEPAIHHAVVALSSLHERLGNGGNGDPLQLHFALKHYGRAIQLIAQPETRIPVWQSKDTPLLACSLFGAFEGMSNHFQSALGHKVSGLKILAERNADDAPASGYGVPSGLLRSTFLQFDSENLELGEPEFSYAGVTFTASPVSSLGAINTVIEAWQAFEPQYNMILRAMKKPDHTHRSECPSTYIIGPSHKFPETIRRYSEWCFAFDAYVQSVMSTSRTLASNDQIPSIILLQMRRLLVRIILHVDLRDGQMDFDRFTPDFESLLSMAEHFVELTIASTTKDILLKTSESPTSAVSDATNDSTTTFATNQETEQPANYVKHSQDSTTADHDFPGIQQHGFLGINPLNTPVIPQDDPIDPTASSTTTALSTRLLTENPSSITKLLPFMAQPTFTLSPGIVLPLHVITTRCRDPNLRRRALALLERCKRKEGQWDSQLFARWGRKVVEREEAAAVRIWNAFLGGHDGDGKGRGKDGMVMRIEEAWQVPDLARLR